MAEDKENKVTVEETKKPAEKGAAKEFDIMKIFNNPIAKALAESGKDMFKKEKPNPDMCKITIEAPSEVVLRLFKV